MSVRQTEDIAREASLFSLRNIFTTSSIMRPAPVAQTQNDAFFAPPSPTQQSFMPQQQVVPQELQGSRLRFNIPTIALATSHTPAAAGISQQDLGIKFSLPRIGNQDQASRHTLKTSFSEAVAAAESASLNSHHNTPTSPAEFRATNLTGMNASRTSAHASEPAPVASELHDAELARLNQAVSELEEKLRSSSARLIVTENSVRVGNAALSTERQQYKDKIISVNAETNRIRRHAESATAALGAREDQVGTIAKLNVAIGALESRLLDADAAAKTATSDAEEMQMRFETAAQACTSITNAHTKLETEYKALDAKTNQSWEAEKVSLCVSLVSAQEEVDRKVANIDTLQKEIAVLKTTQATAEDQIDRLDKVIAGLRLTAVTGGCCSDDSHESEGEDEDEDEGEDGVAVSSANTNAAVGAVDMPVTVPIVVRIGTCCDNCGNDDAKDANDVSDARTHLAKKMHENSCCMGVNFIENSVALSLHEYAPTAEPSNALLARRMQNPTSTNAAMRTNAYVMAVSEDIKKRLVGQRTLWTATAATAAISTPILT